MNDQQINYALNQLMTAGWVKRVTTGLYELVEDFEMNDGEPDDYTSETEKRGVNTNKETSEEPKKLIEAIQLGIGSDDDESSFRKRAEEIRERRVQRQEIEGEDANKNDQEESIDEAVERLSGRVYHVEYHEPDTEPGARERTTIVADQVDPVATGVAFETKDGPRRVYPAPVKFEALDDEEVRKYVQARHTIPNVASMLRRIFNND